MILIRPALVCLFLFAYAVVATAQPGCKTVYLPDLNPTEGVQQAAIAGGYAIPPGVTQPAGAFYPVHLHSTAGGLVNIKQKVGEAWARERWFRNVTRISLVWWTSEFNPDYRFVLNGYQILPNAASAGVEPTWAYHEGIPLVKGADASFNLSTPLQLGEDWNFSVLNRFGEDLWLEKGFALSQICGEEYRRP